MRSTVTTAGTPEALAGYLVPGRCVRLEPLPDNTGAVVISRRAESIQASDPESAKVYYEPGPVALESARNGITVWPHDPPKCLAGPVTQWWIDAVVSGEGVSWEVDVCAP